MLKEMIQVKMMTQMMLVMTYLLMHMMVQMLVQELLAEFAAVGVFDLGLGDVGVAGGTGGEDAAEAEEAYDWLLEEAKEQNQVVHEGEKKQQKREELQTTGRSSRETE